MASFPDEPCVCGHPQFEHLLRGAVPFAGECAAGLPAGPMCPCERYASAGRTCAACGHDRMMHVGGGACDDDVDSDVPCSCPKFKLAEGVVPYLPDYEPGGRVTSEHRMVALQASAASFEPGFPDDWQVIRRAGVFARWIATGDESESR